MYHYALCVSLTLMTFFSYRFIFGKLPDKAVYRPYRVSRTLMGVALLVLSANYVIHLFATPRLADPSKAILINLCTYRLAVWLAYSAAAFALWRLLPPGTPRHVLPVAFAVLFIAYASRVARKVFLTFRRATRLIDDYCSDDVAAYIRWMTVFTYWAVFFGVGQGIFTFVPDRYVFVWIISAIPFYIYLYASYTNYLLFYEEVEGTLQTAAPAGECAGADGGGRAHCGMSRTQEQVIARQLDEWVERKGFTAGGLTIADVARDTATNRTYISAYIGSRYSISFREWVNRLRLGYAKELITANPDMPMAEVAQKAGYLSMSYFTKTFKQAEGVTPGKWGKGA